MTREGKTVWLTLGSWLGVDLEGGELGVAVVLDGARRDQLAVVDRVQVRAKTYVGIREQSTILFNIKAKRSV